MKAFKLFERFNRSHRTPPSRLSQWIDLPSQTGGVVVSPTIKGDQPLPSSRFREQFVSALQEYQWLTGIKLADHPLAKRLQGYHTAEDVMGILREQAQGIDFRSDGRLMKSLSGAVSVLHKLSSSAVLSEVTDLVRKIIQTGVSCL
jgi:hypothetical protein